jgi:beta-N-acetylhexosaminidase
VRRVLFVLFALLAACGSAGEVAISTTGPTTDEPETTEPAAEVPTTTTTEATTTTTIDPIVVLVDGLTLEQKVGQLLMPVLAGTDAVAPTGPESAINQRIAGVDSMAEAVERFALGGVLYLGDNVASAEQLTALSAAIETASQTSTPGIGALISVDQEGGRVNRVTDGVELFPAARNLAPDAVAVRSAAATTAIGLKAQGVNIVLAPVADLTDGNAGVIGNRSYGADPLVAADMVVASVEGLQGVAGVAAAVKHWPGHGDTTLDSHAVLPTIDIDRLTWEQRERVPFAAAVDAEVAIVMVGHLALPGLDPTGAPATVSSVLIEELLRAGLGFDGVVMTDALDMGAVRDQDRSELAIQSVEAGVDILLAPPDLAVVHAGLVDAVVTERISEARLDASVLRILRLKARLGLLS